MDSEDGEVFIKQLAGFVRSHEKALANALPSRRPGNAPRHGTSHSVSSITPPKSPAPLPERPSTASSTASANPRASTFSLGSLSFPSQSVKSAKLALTPHHLFYLLSRFEDLGIDVGPMKIRLENLHDSSTSANYVSFLGEFQRTKSRGSDGASIRSVSSVRSAMSGMSGLLASFGLGAGISAARNERQKAALHTDLKYLYSAFTKIPCLRLAPDWRAKLIKGFEEFPFDSAVPLYVFKNLQILEVSGIDHRQFFGWDRLSEQLRSLTLKRASIEDPADILIDIVLDDMDKRRRRATKGQASPTATASHGSRRSPTSRQLDSFRDSLPSSIDLRRGSVSDVRVGSISNESVDSSSGQSSRRPSIAHIRTDVAKSPPMRRGDAGSQSPTRPTTTRYHTTNTKGHHKMKRSGSGSSHSSLSDSWHNTRASASSLAAAAGMLPTTKWRFLRHLSLSDNSLTTISPRSLTPLANTLHSLDLSTNLFTQIPDSLASLTALRALNLSHCMIDSLHSLLRNPLPAISALNLRANRLQSIAGIERLYPLERLDLRDNRLTDPMELNRLTGIPDIREIWLEGNPFTRTHKDYRITIFNLFRRTPGYTEDIVIDASGPTYNERRYLVDRAEIPAAVPVVKPPAPEVPTVDLSKPAIIQEPAKDVTPARKDQSIRPVPKAVQSEIHTTASRRRRTPKRRIVDLATNEDAEVAAPVSPVSPVSPTSPTSLTRPSGGQAVVLGQVDGNYRLSPSPSIEQTPVLDSVLTESKSINIITPAETPRVDASDTPNLLNGPIIPNRESSATWKEAKKDWSLAGEAYRQKIEVIRDQVGNGYFNVLNDEGWENNQSPTFSTHDISVVSPIGPGPTPARTPSAAQAV